MANNRMFVTRSRASDTMARVCWCTRRRTRYDPDSLKKKTRTASHAGMPGIDVRSPKNAGSLYNVAKSNRFSNKCAMSFRPRTTKIRTRRRECAPVWCQQPHFLHRNFPRRCSSSHVFCILLSSRSVFSHSPRQRASDVRSSSTRYDTVSLSPSSSSGFQSSLSKRP